MPLLVCLLLRLSFIFKLSIAFKAYFDIFRWSLANRKCLTNYPQWKAALFIFVLLLCLKIRGRNMLTLDFRWRSWHRWLRQFVIKERGVICDKGYFFGVIRHKFFSFAKISTHSGLFFLWLLYRCFGCQWRALFFTITSTHIGVTDILAVAICWIITIIRWLFHPIIVIMVIHIDILIIVVFIDWICVFVFTSSTSIL